LQLLDHVHLELGVGTRPRREQIVARRHQSAELLTGRLAQTDVVVERLRLFGSTVEATGDHAGDHRLRHLSVLRLEPAPHRLVEQLVGPDDGEVGAKSDAVKSLQYGVDQLVHRDRQPLLDAGLEHVS
jgi:hypothetical protein